MSQTPCQRGNPEDWYISRDGKQYGDESFLTAEEERKIAMTVLWLADETLEAHQDRVTARIAAIGRDRRRKALQKRRHAREACLLTCPVRVQCLDGAVERREFHGTWGGLFEEDLRAFINQRRINH